MKQHLLDIAEKIIRNSVPSDIAKKYFMLKESIVQKYEQKSGEECVLRDRQVESNCLYGSSAGKKGHLECSSSNKNIPIRKLLYQNENEWERQLGSRIRSVSDINKKYSIDKEKHHRQNSNYNNRYQSQQQQKYCIQDKGFQNQVIADLLTALNKQLKILISDAHHENSSLLYPSILTYFQTRSKSHHHSYSIPEILTISSSRLKQLISQLDATIQEFISSQTFNTKEVVEDNCWLIQNLQALLKENTVLRRMVGKEDKNSHKKKISKS